MTKSDNSRIARQPLVYSTRHGDLMFGRRCLVMGILNVTPDSFSDGGAFLDPSTAVGRAEEMVREGVDVIDIGGESTRPGSQPVSAEVQIGRTVPVIEAIRKSGISVPISIDTQIASVADAAIRAGADIINDISGMRHDSEMVSLLADCDVPFVVMHMRGTPQTMQNAPEYADVVAEVKGFFQERMESFESAGVQTEGRMIVDPGIGFGKTVNHNLSLLKATATVGRDWPVLVGTSRKRFLGEITGESEPQDRLMGTAATVAYSAIFGAAMVRVHDVKPMRQIVDTIFAINCAV